MSEDILFARAGGPACIKRLCLAELQCWRCRSWFCLSFWPEGMKRGSRQPLVPVPAGLAALSRARRMGAVWGRCSEPSFQEMLFQCLVSHPFCAAHLIGL